MTRDIMIYGVMNFDNTTYDIMTNDIMTYDIITYGLRLKVVTIYLLHHFKSYKPFFCMAKN